MVLLNTLEENGNDEDEIHTVDDYDEDDEYEDN